MMAESIRQQHSGGGKSAVLRLVSGLIELNPGPWRWGPGLEVSVAMAVVTGSWTLAGQQASGLVASLGVFTILYGEGWSRRERVHVPPMFALAICAASLVDLLCSMSPFWGVIGLTGITACSAR